jgi:hypothetical protein
LKRKDFILKNLAFWITIFAAIVFSNGAKAGAQTIVDKTVATVSDGVRTELITYSDLLWQLALRPGVSLTPPNSENLNIALQLIINQRVIALEAERLPRSAPTEDEIKNEITRVLVLFPSTAEFETRLRAVGFKSVQDENFREMMEQRAAIEKYIEFRFRAFTVITPDDEAKYYRDVFVPDFRRRFPGSIMPSLDEQRGSISKILFEDKVASEIERFLDEAKRRAEIVILNEV